MISENDYIVISSTKFPKETVKSRFSKLDISHIEYVLECMNHNTTKIKNIKKYLLAALYNAPTTIAIRQECNMTCLNLQIKSGTPGPNV